MKRAGVVLLVLVGVVVAAGIGATAWVNSEFTWCYARFDSRARAEAALAEVRRTAPDADMALERRGRRVSVTFESGESGRDAEAFRRAFRPAVRRQGGTLGHPGDGCLERGPFI
ncbi:MAG TPA: hypothetical protein VM266_02770 [Solirubrobacteraceae bacterium]|nr:hypothetical protein [Solirubrobacteraceae bacterium]